MPWQVNRSARMSTFDAVDASSARCASAAVSNVLFGYRAGSALDRVTAQLCDTKLEEMVDALVDTLVDALSDSL